MSPGEITAICGGVAAIVAAYVGGGKQREKKLYRDNGFERREDSITLGIHDECRNHRETQEIILFKGQDRLEKGQDKLESTMETARSENRDDFKNLFQKIDELKDSCG